MRSECICFHFLWNGPSNLISRQDCCIFKYASVDTHISMKYVRHLTSDIIDRCQQWQMTDDGHKSYQNEFLQYCILTIVIAKPNSTQPKVG